MNYLILLHLLFLTIFPSSTITSTSATFNLSVLLIIVMFLFCLEMGVCLHSPGCSGTYYIDQIGQEFTEVHLSLPLKKGMCHHTWPQLLILYVQSIHSSKTQKATLLDCLDDKQASQNKYVKRGILNPPILPNLLAVHSSLFQPQQYYFTSKILSNPNYIPSKYI